MKHSHSLAVALVLAAMAAQAAEPPRVEELSNPASQSVGKRPCTDMGGHTTWVPYADSCPGGSQAGNSPKAGPAPVDPREAMLKQVEAYERQQSRQQQSDMDDAHSTSVALAEAERYLAGNGVARDIGRAFYQFRAACSYSGNRAGCARAAQVLLDYPVETRTHMESSEQRSSALIAYDIAGRACANGDRDACFLQRLASIEANMERYWPTLSTTDILLFDDWVARYRARPLVAAYLAARLAAQRPAPSIPAAPQLDPRLSNVEQSRLLVQQYENDPARPRAKVELAAQLDPNNAVAWRWVGVSRAVKGDNPGAEQAYLKALALAPGDDQAWYGLGKTYADLAGSRPEDWDRVIDAFQHAADLRKNDTWSLSQLCDAQLAAKKPREALATAERITTISASDSEMWARRGDLELTLNEPARAVASYERVRKLEPHNEAIRPNHAKALCRIGRKKEALAEYRIALDVKPRPAALEADYDECRRSKAVKATD